MKKGEYDPKCDGCKRSQDCDNVPGGIINLDGNWVLNHYQGGEGFLGWMALQPHWHRTEFINLMPNELKALGGNIKSVTLALQQYWKKYFPSDELQRVYAVYFYDSVYDEPSPSLFHLHIHLIPRTQQLDRLLRKCKPNDPNESTIIAWDIHKITTHPDFPKKYRYDSQKKTDKQKAVDLMTYLRGKL